MAKYPLMNTYCEHTGQILSTISRDFSRKSFWGEGGGGKSGLPKIEGGGEEVTRSN